MLTKDEVLLKAEYRCAICGWGGHKSIVHVHHILGKADGGDDLTTNQIVLCSNHHNLVTALIEQYITVDELPNDLSDYEKESVILLAEASIILRLHNISERMQDDNTKEVIDTVMNSLKGRILNLKNNQSKEN